MTSRRAVPLLLIAILSAPTAHAADDTVARFREAYAQYQSLYATGELTAALPFAAEALALGETAYGAESETAARLTLNYARLLLETDQQGEAARQSRRALKRYEKLYGADAIELIDPLMNLGHASVTPGRRQIFAHYRRALDIAESTGDTLLAAELNYDAGVRLLGHGNSMEGARFLEASVAAYGTALGERHQKTALAHLWLARFHFGNRDYDRSIAHSVRAGAGFSGVPELARTTADLLASACSRLRRDPDAEVPAACP